MTIEPTVETDVITSDMLEAARPALKAAFEAAYRGDTSIPWPNPRAPREQLCDECGEPIGFFAREPRDFLTCSAPACIQAERDHHRQIAAEAEEDARADDFGRYR